MTEESQADTPTPIVTMYRDDVVRVLVLGIIAGVFVWLLALLLHRYVFDVYLCQNGTREQCGSAKDYAVAVASFVAAIPALGALVRMRVYRPLLVVLASGISVWGVTQVGLNFGWLTGLAMVAVMHGLAFGAYAWLARIRNFWIALAAIVVVVIITRLILAV